MTSREALVELVTEAKSLNSNDERLTFLREQIEKDLEVLDILKYYPAVIDAINNCCMNFTDEEWKAVADWMDNSDDEGKKFVGFESLSSVYIPDTRQLNNKYKDFIDSLDKDFYELLYTELVKTMPQLLDVLKMNEELSERYDFDSGTFAWHLALKTALGEGRYNEAYEKLNWYDVDFLDGEIESRLEKWYILNKERSHNDK